MSSSKQPVPRRHGCDIGRLADLADTPRPFRLMGEHRVLVMDAAEHQAALREENWMACDRSGLIIRRRPREHGESEVRRPSHQDETRAHA